MTKQQQNTQTQLQEQQYEEQIKILLEKDLEKNSKPLWLTKQFVEKPICVIGVSALIFLISLLLVGLLELFSFSENTNRDYLIWSNERVQQYDSWTQMQQEFQENLQDTQVPERSQEINVWTTNIMVKCDKCNILESKYINILYEFEQELKKLTNFNKLCLASTQSTECAQDSYISFMPLFPDSDGSDLSNSEIQNMKNYVLDEANFDTMKYLFGADFTSSNPETNIIRSIFKFGAPLNIDGKLFKDKFDDFQEQKGYFTEFSQKLIDLQEDLQEKHGNDDLQIMVFSRRIDSIIFQSVIDTDFLWAFASIVFVWFYITMHLHSFFLGSVAMFNILMSFPLTVVIFRLIFQITYFSSLHILAVFVVLGIAADDVFVFMDAWGQTEFYEQLKGDLNKRMAVTFRRAAKAMVATSSTTSAAFFATGLSTIMPISSFGFFAGVLVPMNFILVITFFPAVLIVQNKYFKQCCVRNKKNKIQTQNNQVAPQKYEQQQQEQQQQQLQQNISVQQENQVQSQDQINQEDVQNIWKEQQPIDIGQISNEKKESKVEKFFGEQFNNFVFKARYLILVVFLIWTSIAIWRTSQMSPITEPEKFLPDDSMIELAEASLRTDFHQSGASDNGIKVFFTWGINSIDKEDVSMWDPENLGEIIWDDEFDLSPKNNQSKFLELCQDIKTHELVQDQEVLCFMEGFQQWLIANSQTFPVEQNEFIPKLTQFAQDPAGGLLFYNQNQIGLIKGELKYVFIILSAKGTPFTPYDELNPVYEKWEQLELEINQNSPKGMNNMFQSASFHWVWMISERAFVTNAIQGMTISLAFACVVLLLSTHNIVISFYSIISISGIVVSVVAIMELLGWELGIAESITIVILIGLSVDFVVHLANHYVESVYPDKFRRMQISLKEIAISIVSGAFTTMGAGIFLFFAVVVIFNKFALLIVATITFSLAYSLFFFSALLHAFGPQNDFGNIKSLCKQKKQNTSQNQQDENQSQDNKNQQEVINKNDQENNLKVLAVDNSSENKQENLQNRV